jgi:CubicO group peptidase (beta-lactamase class C family)
LSDLCTYSLARKLVVVDRGSESRCVGPARLQLGGTGLLSTALDCLLFFQMLLAHGLHDGQQVVSRSVVDLLIRHCLPQRSIPGEGIGSGIVSSSSPYGNPPPAGSFPSFFSRGAAGTIAWVDPSKQIIAVFLTQLIPPLMVTRYYPYLGTERLGPELGCVHPGMFDFIAEIEQRIHRALQE